MKQAAERGEPKVERVQSRAITLEAQHRSLDERLRELARRSHPTPTERAEIAELKKHKLRAKDELTALRRGQ